MRQIDTYGREVILIDQGLPGDPGQPWYIQGSVEITNLPAQQVVIQGDDPFIVEGDVTVKQGKDPWILDLPFVGVPDNYFENTEGDAVPAEAAFIAGLDSNSGRLMPMRVDDGGNQFARILGIDSFFMQAQPSVSYVGFPGIGSFMDMNAGLWLGSDAPTVGQKVMADSLPVVIASDQTAIPVTGSFSLTFPTFGAAFPATGPAVGFSDGVNMQGARVFDLDSGGGVQYVQGANLRRTGAGGSVELIGSQLSANSLPVVMASDWIGPVQANQGDPNSGVAGQRWPMGLTDAGGNFVDIIPNLGATDLGGGARGLATFSPVYALDQGTGNFDPISKTDQGFAVTLDTRVYGITDGVFEMPMMDDPLRRGFQQITDGVDNAGVVAGSLQVSIFDSGGSNIGSVVIGQDGLLGGTALATSTITSLTNNEQTILQRDLTFKTSGFARITAGNTTGTVTVADATNIPLNAVTAILVGGIPEMVRLLGVTGNQVTLEGVNGSFHTGIFFDYPNPDGPKDGLVTPMGVAPVAGLIYNKEMGGYTLEQTGKASERSSKPVVLPDTQIQALTGAISELIGAVKQLTEVTAG